MSRKITQKNSINIQNRQARHEFFIKNTFEAGIVLTGIEVKSIRAGQVNISDGYIVERNRELFLQNTTISTYKFAFADQLKSNYNPQQLRKLLLHKKEINKCIASIQKKGMTIVPLAIYSNKRGLIKIEIGLAEGKKLHDKRASLKEQEWNRDKARMLKDFGLK